MIRHLRRYFAIRSYMMRLSGELVRRFGERAFYKIAHVDQAVQRGGFSPAFVAYAHAAYCVEVDFNAHYEPLGVVCTYKGLREVIARRYFSGRSDFDTHTILNRLGRVKYASDSFTERDSSPGSDSGGDSSHY